MRRLCRQLRMALTFRHDNAIFQRRMFNDCTSIASAMLSANIGRVKGSFRLSGSTEHRRAPGSYSWQESSYVELTEYFNKYLSCETSIVFTWTL